MPEKNPVTDRLIACEPIHVGNVTVLPIQRVKLQSQTAAAHAWLAASKEPVALVVRDSDGTRTIDIAGTLSIEQLRDQIPDLDALIVL
ncbi:MAG: hypothetical protein JSU95_10250 [Betaproteobacteria bacterium]|nr:MAG: hypothetical protein JSU95_10250 [Betaproteobacteria bacterium]